MYSLYDHPRCCVENRLNVGKCRSRESTKTILITQVSDYSLIQSGGSEGQVAVVRNCGCLPCSGLPQGLRTELPRKVRKKKGLLLGF